MLVLLCREAVEGTPVALADCVWVLAVCGAEPVAPDVAGVVVPPVHVCTHSQHCTRIS